MVVPSGSEAANFSSPFSVVAAKADIPNKQTKIQTHRLIALVSIDLFTFRISLG
jgi:hypothetical protein